MLSYLYLIKNILFLTFLSLVFSFGGIVWAWHYSCPKNGGIGGALAVAVAFFLSFPGKSIANKIQGLRKDPPEIEPAVVDPATELLNLTIKLKEQSDIQYLQLIALGLAGTVGTLVWAFGEMIVNALIQHHVTFCQ